MMNAGGARLRGAVGAFFMGKANVLLASIALSALLAVAQSAPLTSLRAIHALTHEIRGVRI